MRCLSQLPTNVIGLLWISDMLYPGTSLSWSSSLFSTPPHTNMIHADIPYARDPPSPGGNLFRTGPRNWRRAGACAHSSICMRSRHRTGTQNSICLPFARNHPLSILPVRQARKIGGPLPYSMLLSFHSPFLNTLTHALLLQPLYLSLPFCIHLYSKQLCDSGT